MAIKDLTGQKFGKLTVIGWAESRMRNAYWECRCDCGKVVIIRGSNLRSGETKSCGCLHRELTSAIGKKANFRHGLYQNRLYRIWGDMKTRCNNPNSKSYARYGERGIKVCDEWNEFEPFYNWAINNGFAKGLEIDRKDNDKGYNPDNCRWITKKQNARNRRTSKMILVNGDTKTQAEWEEFLGLRRGSLYEVSKKGIDPTEYIKGILKEDRHE